MIWDGIRSWLFEMRMDICLAGLIVLGMAYLARPDKEKPGSKKETWIAAILALVAFFATTRFGQFQPQGIHAHDVFHYQFGSKYAPENGYTGIYEATAAGLQELAKEGKIPPGRAPHRIRTLADKASEQSVIGDAEREKIKARFTPERWAELKRDLAGYDRVYDLSWDRVVNDAGYNPTPWWTALGNLVNMGLTSAESYQAVKFIDAAFLAVALAMVWQTFGARAAAFAAALTFFFPPGRYAPFDYTGASMLRLSWMFWVTVGVCAFHTKRFALAGAALGLATMERVFPGAFALAAAIVAGALALDNPRKAASWAPLAKLAAGGAAAAAFALAASIALYGVEPWAEFARFIPQHTSLLFTNHTGWGKAISVHPHMQDVGFSKENMGVLRDWSQFLLARNHWAIFLVTKALLIGGITIWALRRRDTAAFALLGASLVFFFSMPAHYYLMGMLAPYAAAFAADQAQGTKTLGAWLIFGAAASTLFMATGETAGWSLMSATVVAGMAYGCGSLCTPGKPRLGGLLGLGAWIFVLAYPELSTPSGPEKIPAKIYVSAPWLSRQFIDDTGREIKDRGFILTKEGVAGITTTSWDNHRLMIRTDRAFPGELELQTPEGKPIQRWKVEARGSIFDTLSTPLPQGTKFQLRWFGPGKDIGIFSIWTEAQPKSFRPNFPAPAPAPGPGSITPTPITPTPITPAPITPDTAKAPQNASN